MNDQNSDTPEVVTMTALESITRGEIDLQISTAHKFPRSMSTFKRRATDMATIDEETAESCIYVRPVGMKDGQMQYAEGLSVRLAEIVGACYGNVRVGSMIIEQTDRMVKCRGFAHDLETNFASTSETMEPTVTKRGEPFSEGMRAVVAKACLAKAWRDALFKVVPRALCKPIESEVRKLASGEGKSLESRRAAAMQWVAKLGIDQARVFKALNIIGESDLGSEHLAQLFGLKTAIKEGDVKIEDAFPPLDGIPSETKGPKLREDPKETPTPANWDAKEREALLQKITEAREADGLTVKQVREWCHRQNLLENAAMPMSNLTTDGMKALLERWEELRGGQG